MGILKSILLFAVVFLTASFSIENGSTLRDGLKAYWSLNQGGMCAFDELGRTKGEFKNALNYGLRKAPQFNGSPQYIEFGDVLDLGTNSLTVNAMVWLNTTSGNQTVICKTRATASKFRFAFRIINGQLATLIYGNSGSDVAPKSTGTVSAQRWTMVTFILDRNSNVRMLINGVEQTLDVSGSITTWYGVDFQSTDPLRIGAYTASDGVGLFGNYFNGYVAEIGIWHRVLTNNEIKYKFVELSKNYH